MSEVMIRPMREDDVVDAERVSAESFFELDSRLPPRGLPTPARRPAEQAARWIARVRHFLVTDPGGCWVADDGERMLGFATSFRREVTWCLATFVVLPGLQGRGIGRRILDAALEHSRGCSRGMLAASSDARALRRYHAAGFALHPQMHATGTVDRSAIPVVDRVREGSAADIDLMDSLDRQTRGSGHGPDHALMLGTWRLLVSDTSTGSGYAYVGDARGVQVLAASNRATATRLLWEALATGPDVVTQGHLTGANQWAIDVVMRARLDLHQEGYLGLRGMAPPAPYIHNGALL